jgi:hypothetical protein
VGVPAPPSLSARSIFDLRGVEYIPVAQMPAAENAELKDWTGHRNAPVALYNDEAPRVRWQEILDLAERLGTGPSLYPADIDQRMLMVGLVSELIGENGLFWNLRLVMLGLAGPERAAKEAARNPMYEEYGYSETAREAALEKSQVILERFTEHARQQHARSSNYLMDDSLSALDIYWANFSQSLGTLPEEVCPMPRGLRQSWDLCTEAMGGVDPLLLQQRDWIFANHLQLPLLF